MDFDALTQPFVFKAPLKKATTTGPDFPSALVDMGGVHLADSLEVE